MEPWRGVNLGTALDALPGLPPHDRHLDAITAAGFGTVRVTAG